MSELQALRGTAEPPGAPHYRTKVSPSSDDESDLNSSQSVIGVQSCPNVRGEQDDVAPEGHGLIRLDRFKIFGGKFIDKRRIIPEGSRLDARKAVAHVLDPFGVFSKIKNKVEVRMSILGEYIDHRLNLNRQEC